MWLQEHKATTNQEGRPTLVLVWAVRVSTSLLDQLIRPRLDDRFFRPAPGTPVQR
jgi:hypothetical protein